MAEVLEVSESGYHQWKARQTRPKTEKEKERDDLTKEILNIYLDSNCVYGGRKIAKEIGREYRKAVNHEVLLKRYPERLWIPRMRGASIAPLIPEYRHNQLGWRLLTATI